MKKLLSIILTLLFLSLQSIFGQKYNAGFTSLKLVDTNRIYELNTSETDSLHYRPIDIDIWYPSKDKKGKPLMFGDLFKQLEQRANSYQEETDYSGLTRELAQFYVAELGIGADGQKLLEIKTNSFSDLEPSKQKHPVIIYMAGFNGMGFENYKVLEKLAENGFIVASISSIGRYPGRYDK